MHEAAATNKRNAKILFIAFLLEQILKQNYPGQFQRLNSYFRNELTGSTFIL
jgi:hypothetical protein